jgi:titin
MNIWSHRARRVRADLGIKASAQVEILERQLLLSTFTVTNNADSGPSSLRQAITDSDTHLGSNTIDFAIPGAGVHTIRLLSALPSISDAVTIDGTTQPGYSGMPLISLTPSTVDSFTGDGLTLLGGGSTVRGLDIEGFNGNGIRITRGGGNIIQNNRIGTDPAGTTAWPNSGSGILIEASSNNTILDNLVSGNGAAGITLTDTAAPLGLSDTLRGDLSGSLADTPVTEVFPSFSGNYSLQGLLHGAFFNLSIPNAPGQLTTTATISNSMTAVTGTTTLGPWSATLSGQGLTQTLNAPASTAPTAITVSESGITETFALTGTLGGSPYTITGTFLGTFKSDNVTTVSGPVSGPMTLAVQETLPAVTSTPTGNLISGNKIGTDVNGNAALGNTLDGILLKNASSNSITGNVVSRNGVGQDAAGIDLLENASDNTIAGNMIGTNASGTTTLGNSLDGIEVGNGSSNNILGPNNVISSNGAGTNRGVGVYIFSDNTSGNMLQGNAIGTNSNGTAAIKGSVIGVLINEASGNVVQNNVISGNKFIGVDIAAGTATKNVVEGNHIGTNKAGTAAIPNGSDGIFINNAPGNTIGGNTSATGNLVSGNGQVGIQIFGLGARGNLIQNNILGRNASRGVSPGLLNGGSGDLGIYVNTIPNVNTIVGNVGQGLRLSPTGAPFVPNDPQSTQGSTTRVQRPREHSRPFAHRPFYKARIRLASKTDWAGKDASHHVVETPLHGLGSRLVSDSRRAKG